MKQLNILAATLLLLTSIACGPSAEEKAAQQKRHDDSVSLATKQAMDTENAIRQKQHDDSLASATKHSVESKQKLEQEMADIKRELQNATADLEVATNELKKSKEFHALRTKSTREKEVKEQSLKVQQLQERVTKLQEELAAKRQELSGT